MPSRRSYNSAFSYSASRNTMGSNAYTDVKQGGGNKKAGLVSSVGLDSNWVHIYYAERGLPRNLVFMRTAPKRVPLISNSNLPIGIAPPIKMR